MSLRESKILALPWSVDPDDREGYAWNNHILDSEGNRVCFMANDGTSSNARGESRARYLVAAANALADHRNPREALAQRRTGGAIDFAYENINALFTVGFSLYPARAGEAPRCAEIFMNVAPTQGSLEANVRDAGILASYALQHGATIEQLVAGLTHESDGSASSIVGLALNLVKAEIDRIADADPAAGASGPTVGLGDGEGR